MVVDANILLFLLIGEMNLDRALTFSRTRSHFLKEDLPRFNELFASLPYIVTTPHILAETSSLGNDLDSHEREPFRERLAATANRLHEEHVPASVVLTMPEMLRFGLADAALIHLARNGFLILTLDAGLAGYIEHSGHASINYNHISYKTVKEASWH